MRDPNPHWLNFRWAIDVQYTHVSNVSILAALVKTYKRFWDGEFFYKRQSSFILRWPDWRKRYRVDLESYRRHHKMRDPEQTKLTVLLNLNGSNC